MLVLRSVEYYLEKYKFILLPADIIADLYFIIRDKGFFYELGREFFSEISEKSFGKLLDLLYIFGWGKFQIVWYSKSRIIVKGISVFARQLKKYYGVQKTPVDDFILGVLDAWAEKNDLKIKFKEIECIAMGSDKCVFMGELIKRPKHYLVEIQQRLRGEIT